MSQVGIGLGEANGDVGDARGTQRLGGLQHMVEFFSHDPFRTYQPVQGPATIHARWRFIRGLSVKTIAAMLGDPNPAPVALPAYLSDFLASNDGLVLAKTFTRIKEPKLRRCVINLVEEIAPRRI